MPIPRASSAAAMSASCARDSTTPASSGKPIRRRSSPTGCPIWRTSPFRPSWVRTCDKTKRMMALVKELGGEAPAVRAARLSKCDLSTELVKEFTELQGVVGGLYARAQGERARSLAGDLRPLQAGEHGGCHPAPPRRPAGFAGRQARHAARLLPRWLDSHRLARSVRVAARGAGRCEDPGGRQNRSCRCLDLLEGNQQLVGLL